MRQLRQGFSPQRHLVGDGDSGALEPPEDFARRGGGVFIPMVGKSRAADIGFQGSPVKKNDMFHS
jgi:hypothetical protein